MVTSAVFGVKMTIQLGALVLLARYLGPEGYGQFTAIAAVGIGLGTLSSLGLGILVLRESAQSVENGRTMLERAIPATLVGAAVLSPLFLLVCRLALDSAASLSVLLLVGVTDLLLIPLTFVLAQLIRGAGHVALSQTLGIFPIVLRATGLGVCFLWMPDGGLTIYAAIYALSGLAGLAVDWLVARKTTGLPNSYQLPNRELLKEGAPFAAMRFTTQNPSELDKALALRVLSPTDVGLYSLAARGLAIAVLPVLAIVMASQPRLFKQLEDGPSGATRLAGTVLFCSLAVGVVAGLAMAYLLPQLLEAILGATYSTAVSVLPQLALVAPFMSLRLGAAGLMTPLNQPLRRSVLEGLGILLLVPLCLAWGAEHGIAGVVAAVLVAEAFMALTMCACVISALKRPASAEGSGIGVASADKNATSSR